MTIIFKAKTTDAYRIKIVAELLSNNLKTAHLEIDGENIYLCQMDSNRKILVRMKLLSENFSLYKIKRDKMYLGINLNHFHRMLKSIKKKDSLELFIDDESPTDLAIQVIPKENNRKTTSFIKIQTIQEIAIDVPTGYGKPVILSSSEFQKMIKDMGSIGNTINVLAKNFHIQFSCDAGGILKRTVEFGEMEDSDDEDNVSEKTEYEQNFSSDQLTRITKIAGLDSQMKIYPGKPLLFKSNVGSLGDISIYIKSKEQIEEESLVLCEESE